MVEDWAFGQVNGVLSAPEVASWALAQKLKNRRRELKITMEQLSRALGLSRARWSQIENEHYIIAEAMLPELAGILGFDDEEMDDLQRLRRAASSKYSDWLEAYRGALNDEFLRYCAFESAATLMRVFSSTIIDGLFQTAGYAQKLISSNPQVSVFHQGKALELRLLRQKRLREEPSLQIHAVVYEAALVANFGDDLLLYNQLEHLLALIDELEDSVQLQVMPWTATPSGMTGGSTLHLLDFDRSDLPTVIWDETLLGQLRFEDHDQAGLISLIYDQAVERSYDRSRSRDVIAARAEALAP